MLSDLCLCTPGVPKCVVKDCVYLLVHEKLVGKAELCTQYKVREHTHTHKHRTYVHLHTGQPLNLSTVF